VLPAQFEDTPLHDAVQRGHAACVRLLVARGAPRKALNKARVCAALVLCWQTR
jgi:ankyrin repeat protein